MFLDPTSFECESECQRNETTNIPRVVSEKVLRY